MKEEPIMCRSIMGRIGLHHRTLLSSHHDWLWWGVMAMAVAAVGSSVGVAYYSPLQDCHTATTDTHEEEEDAVGKEDAVECSSSRVATWGRRIMLQKRRWVTSWIHQSSFHEEYARMLPLCVAWWCGTQTQPPTPSTTLHRGVNFSPWLMFVPSTVLFATWFFSPTTETNNDTTAIDHFPNNKVTLKIDEETELRAKGPEEEDSPPLSSAREDLMTRNELEPPLHNKEGDEYGTMNSDRYLELLVHNVSHTDLLLSLASKNIENVLTMEQQHDPMMENKNRQQPQQSPLHNNYSTETTNNADAEREDPFVLCRPRFSTFDFFSRRVLEALTTWNGATVTDGISSSTNSSMQHAHDIISFPRYKRSDATQRYNIVTPRPHKRGMLPVGLKLSSNSHDPCQYSSRLQLSGDDLASLRLRGRDVPKLSIFSHTTHNNNNNQQQQIHETSDAPLDVNHVPSPPSTPRMLSPTDTNTSLPSPPLDDASSSELLALNAVFFPLLSTLLPRWLSRMDHKHIVSGRKVKKVVVLVSGVGTPRNWTHSINGNSTEACADLMELFLHRLYPDVTVVKIHSETNIFRYDENILFANQELMPCIDAYRDAHARGEPYPDEVLLEKQSPVHDRRRRQAFCPDWKDTCSVTLSFADGSPARTHAIQASLRPYRPTYFHFWQLKTFWHESKVCDDDIEIHSFEDMETVPARQVNHCSKEVQMVVDEMKDFRTTFLETLSDPDESSNDIRSFWLRKTKKPVLAVLLVEQPGKPQTFVLYRGSNMEVSMPTGSLCAERNVIGSALASNPALQRQDLRMVAVLALPLPNNNPTTTAAEKYTMKPPPGVDTSVCSVIDDGVEGSVVSEVPVEYYIPIEKKESSSTLDERERPTNMRRSVSVASYASIVEGDYGDDENENEVNDNNKKDTGGDCTMDQQLFTQTLASLVVKDDASLIEPSSSHYSRGRSPRVTISSPPGTPIRRIQLYHDGTATGRSSSSSVGKNDPNQRSSEDADRTTSQKQKRRTVVKHHPKDINPLKPCGACNEWLKKIAESNPYFKVVTFTDADCNGVYLNSCQE